MPRPRKPATPFRYFKTSPEVIRLTVLLYVKASMYRTQTQDRHGAA